MSADRDLRHVERRRGVGATVQRLERLPLPVHGVIIILLIAAITGLDLVTSSLVSLSIFYLIPVVWATWFIGRKSGLAVAILSALVWSMVEHETSASYFPVEITGWNVVARLTLFLFIALVLAELRQSSETRRQLAYSDPLTGIANTRVLEADREYQ